MIVLDSSFVVACHNARDAHHEAREVEFVPCSRIFPDALHAFSTQRSGRLSFTDAAIVAVARARGAEAVATFDADFRRVESIRVVPA